MEFSYFPGLIVFKGRLTPKFTGLSRESRGKWFNRHMATTIIIPLETKVMAKETQSACNSKH